MGVTVRMGGRREGKAAISRQAAGGQWGGGGGRGPRRGKRGGLDRAREADETAQGKGKRLEAEKRKGEDGERRMEMRMRRHKETGKGSIIGGGGGVEECSAGLRGRMTGMGRGHREAAINAKAEVGRRGGGGWVSRRGSVTRVEGFKGSYDSEGGWNGEAGGADHHTGG